MKSLSCPGPLTALTVDGTILSLQVSSRNLFRGAAEEASVIQMAFKGVGDYAGAHTTPQLIRSEAAALRRCMLYILPAER